MLCIYARLLYSWRLWSTSPCQSLWNWEQYFCQWLKNQPSEAPGNRIPIVKLLWTSVMISMTAGEYWSRSLHYSKYLVKAIQGNRDKPRKSSRVQPYKQSTWGYRFRVASASDQWKAMLRKAVTFGYNSLCLTRSMQPAFADIKIR